VNEGVKCVIPERIISIESTSTFFDLFDLTMMGQYDNREVKVSISRENSEGWKEVDKGLDSDLKILEALGFMQLKFCLVSDTNLDTTVSTQNRPDAFDILMKNSRQLLLPQRCTEHNNYHRLYNEIIELFEAQKVGWTCGSHETLGKEFVNHLTSALWYIDPHISTLHARLYHLPVLFTQLKTYQNGNNSMMYQVSACEPHQLKDEYTQLDDLLSEKSFYEHVEIQQYLPNDAID
ncbi:27588_t:CDS:2, partial [Dentiscutata erythropus]